MSDDYPKEIPIGHWYPQLAMTIFVFVWFATLFGAS